MHFQNKHKNKTFFQTTSNREFRQIGPNVNSIDVNESIWFINTINFHQNLRFMTRKNEVITSTVSENSVTGNFCWNHSKVRIFIQNRLFSGNYFFAKWVNYEKKLPKSKFYLFFERVFFSKRQFFQIFG